VLSGFWNIVSTMQGKSGVESITLVDIGLGIVRLLVLLVDNSILGSGGSAGQACVVVLGDGLVGLLGGLSSTALDGLRDVVGGILYQVNVSVDVVKVLFDESCEP